MSGEVLQITDYLPYGKERITQRNTDYKNKYGFIGKEKDNESGLNYVEARYYDGNLGRFVAQDRMFWEVGQTKTRNVIILLNNMFLSNKIIGSKHEIGNNELIELVYRGDHVVTQDSRAEEGLLFSIATWRKTLRNINNAALNIFGEFFYSPYSSRVNIIALHDAFLDYIDKKRAVKPKKLPLFIEIIEQSPGLEHFSVILKSEGVI